MMDNNMKFFTLSIILITFLFENIQGDDCPNGWIRYLDSCIGKFADNLNSALQINILCGLKGGTPIKIDSPKKLSFVQIYLQSATKNYYFLGLRRIGTTGNYSKDFTWHDNTGNNRSRPGQKSPRTEVAQKLIEVAQSCDRSRPEL
ncbi:DgyrCDS14620 [Dimorphilus gyrociliatus]|uniref:DgyrCDS14620 n=1 Tax=Dimorphilus gyrociliatus TaxID=2664684 RepID=A0A7I8WE99_9ANNE|nr:DgyrCDS14620 [Dimorphilus gyrociliatus]